MKAWKTLHAKKDADVARALRVPATSWLRWLNGYRPCPLSIALDLVQMTGLPIERLVIEGAIQAPKSKSDRSMDRCAQRAEQVLANNNLPGAPERQQARTA